MVSNAERQKVLRKKLQVLKAITRSKSEKKSGIISDALDFITQLKQKVDEMRKDLENQVHLPTMDVEVEKLENGCFRVKVRCEKAQDLLVSLVEAFEEMGLDVLHADIDASQFFDMEAIIEAEDHTIDVEHITVTIYKVLRNKGVKNT